MGGLRRRGCKWGELFKTTMRINVNQGDEIVPEGPGSRRAKGVTEVRVIAEVDRVDINEKERESSCPGSRARGEWLEPADRCRILRPLISKVSLSREAPANSFPLQP